jgi:3-methylcrotonyl-CoA carboxylase alpha subunit
MGTRVIVTRLAHGMYRVEHDGGNAIVYVAGPAAERWVFWNGRVFHEDEQSPGLPAARRSRPATGESLIAPMPARVIKLPVQLGSHVKKGDTIVILEAMKMELPVRAPIDAVVSVVHCREGDLVDAGAVLVDLVPH